MVISAFVLIHFTSYLSCIDICSQDGQQDPCASSGIGDCEVVRYTLDIRITSGKGRLYQA